MDDFPTSETDTALFSPEECTRHRREELVRRLQANKSAASHWIHLARAFLHNGCLDDAIFTLTAFRDSLTEESSEELPNIALAFLHDLQRQTLFRRDVDRKAELEAINRTTSTATVFAKNDLLTTLQDGLLLLLKGEGEKAETQFCDTAKKLYKGKKSLLPFLALGISSFKSKDYRKALAYFTHVLKRLGSKRCPMEIRVAIGFCFLYMGQLDHAIVIFKRSQPHLGAAYGLICSYLKKYTSHSYHRRENFHKAMKCTLELLMSGESLEGGAFQSVAFLLLGRIALLHGDYSSAAALSERSACLTASDHILAQSSLLQARAHHAMGHFTAALRHYTHALELKPEMALARYGLSQMHIASGNLRNGATSLEQILSLFLDDPATQSLLTKAATQNVPLDHGRPTHITHEHAGAAVQLLQALSSQLSPSGKEKNWISSLFHTLTEKDTRHTSPETFVSIGELMSGRDRMEAFKKALELYKQQTEASAKHNAAISQGSSSESNLPRMDVSHVPLHVHNNAAVAFFQMYKERDVDWQWCLQNATDHAKRALALYQEEKPRLSKVTLLFNRARTLEENRFYNQAASMYKEIVQSAPQYAEAHIQLMAIFRKMGRLDLAIDQGVESAKNFPNSPVIRTILGGLCLEAGEYVKSKEYLYSVTKGGYPKDVLALVLLEDLRFSANRQKAKGHWIRALENFCMALTVDPHCLHAAHGASAVLGSFGRCTEIPKLYESIVDATSRQQWAASRWSFVNPIPLPAAEINLGHLWFAKKQYSHAAKLYQYSLELYKTTGHPDPSIQTLVARAHYDSRSHFELAVVALRRLAHLRPWDKANRFNLALVLQGAGVHFIVYFKIPTALPDDRPLKQLRSALDNIDQALALYQGLKLIPEEVLLMKHAALEEQIQICHDYKQKGEEAAASVTALLEKQAVQDQINKREWEAHLVQQAEEKRKREEEKRKRDAEQEELHKRLSKERAERKAMQALTPQQPKPRKKRSRNEQRKTGPRQARAFMEALNRYSINDVQDEEATSQEEEMADLELDDDVGEMPLEEKEEVQDVKVRRTTLLSDDEQSD